MATVVWYDSSLGGHELDKVRENDYPRGAPWAHLAIPQSIQTKGKAKEKSHLRHENCTRSEPIAARLVGNDQSFPYFVITFCRLRELRKLESSIWDKKGAAIKKFLLLPITGCIWVCIRISCTWNSFMIMTPFPMMHTRQNSDKERSVYLISILLKQQIISLKI